MSRISDSIQISDFSFYTGVYVFTTSSIPYGSPLLFILDNCRKCDLHVKVGLMHIYVWCEEIE